MSTHTQLLYHIVFSTKNRESVITPKNKERLLKYIWGIIKNQKSVLYRIKAEKDHIHILTHIHPRVALSEFVKKIKASSTIWIKDEKVFPRFSNCQEGYGAFTYSTNDKNNIVNYIKDQEEHHKKVSFIDEYKEMLDAAGIKYELKYLE